jgi:glycosyltransferase involved in cell wall biosynthesis
VKITIVSQFYLPFVGGIQLHVRQVAHALRARGHDVQIIAANFAPFKLSPRLASLNDSLLVPRFDSYVDQGVPVHALTPSPLQRLRLLPIAVRAIPKLQRYAFDALRHFGYLVYRPAFAPQLRRLIGGSDIVHCFGFGYLLWTAQAVAKELKIPCPCIPFVHPRQWGDARDDVAHYKQADAVIGLVETDKQYLASLGVPLERLRVIGVSPNLPPTADPLGFRTRHTLGTSPLVLYVGRMMPQKGASATLAAAELVWKQIPDAKFVFIGPANADEGAVFRDCDPRIQYLGKVSDQEKADALSACDVFCMPSTSEILPTVYLEAWSYGKPVVGGTANGLRELVEGNGAGRISEQNPVQLSGILIDMLANPGLRSEYGERGRRLVKEQYSVDAVADAFCTLYSELIEAATIQSPMDARSAGGVQ